MTRRYPFMQVDAFCTQRLAGNPCAIVFDADDLDDAMRLAIARENNLSETSFVVRSDKADIGARYFTPSREIPLAGHPTVATIHALVETGRLPLDGPRKTVSLEIGAGVISVEIERATDALVRVTMSQLKPRFLDIVPAAEIAPAIGLTPEDLLPDHPPRVVSTGSPQVMVPVRDLSTLRRAMPDIPLFDSMKAAWQFYGAHAFCLGSVTAEGQTFARHFDTPPDPIEDPFTGSATGGMAAYLWRYGLIATPDFVAEQGHWMDRPGQAQVAVIGPRDDIETVKVGGTAVTVITGELMV